eukprot:Gregarina_sp_Pseudo_9__681@NODE_1432_length_1609_cov_11_837580_g1330_i0_p1_GENE_NODE_1432_length_1609_cov_11_837580_g1330_i0NODE_1432_length_1609_cov_11_837580_g1330_i0_p1_ORF_typecomplete_len436_score55_30_NODE_1432_length_1609_cov_11_837580_g1330_i0881395
MRVTFLKSLYVAEAQFVQHSLKLSPSSASRPECLTAACSTALESPDPDPAAIARCLLSAGDDCEYQGSVDALFSAEWVYAGPTRVGASAIGNLGIDAVFFGREAIFGNPIGKLLVDFTNSHPYETAPSAVICQLAAAPDLLNEQALIQSLNENGEFALEECQSSSIAVKITNLRQVFNIENLGPLSTSYFILSVSPGLTFAAKYSIAYRAPFSLRSATPSGPGQVEPSPFVFSDFHAVSDTTRCELAECAYHQGFAWTNIERCLEAAPTRCTYEGEANATVVSSEVTLLPDGVRNDEYVIMTENLVPGGIPKDVTPLEVAVETVVVTFKANPRVTCVMHMFQQQAEPLLGMLDTDFSTVRQFQFDQVKFPWSESLHLSFQNSKDDCGVAIRSIEWRGLSIKFEVTAVPKVSAQSTASASLATYSIVALTLLISQF